MEREDDWDVVLDFRELGRQMPNGQLGPLPLNVTPASCLVLRPTLLPRQEKTMSATLRQPGHRRGASGPPAARRGRMRAPRRPASTVPDPFVA
jgi:hypothetical protein